MNELLLDLARQRHREAVDIDLVGVETFGLEVDLMPLAVGKPHDLVFERRTVARTDAADLPVVERAAIDARRARGRERVVRVKQPAADAVLERRSSWNTRTAPVASSPASTCHPACVGREVDAARSSRGGVPVFRRPTSKPNERIDSARSLRRRFPMAARRHAARRRHESGR